MKRTILADDLTNETSPDVTSVRFALEGVMYEIDLTAKNADALRKTLAKYTDAARRIGGRQASKPQGTRGHTAEIREWARSNGRTVPDRGRIPADVVDAWQASKE